MRALFRFELLLILAFSLITEPASSQETEPELQSSTVSMLSGEVIEGRLLRLDKGSFTIATGERAASDAGQQFAIADVERISFGSTRDKSATPNQLIRLVDASLLSAKGFTITDQTASIQLSGNGASSNGTRVEISTRDIDWIRTELSSTLDVKWNDATKKPAASDTLYLLKEGELETLEGVIQGVGEERLQFKFDGDVIEARRSRITGMSFYHAAGRELPAAAVLCRDRFGGQFIATSIELSDKSSLKIALASGGEVELPVESLLDLDFTVGKVLYLSEVAVEAEQWAPQIDAAALQEPLSKLMKWNTNRSLTGKSLKLYSANGFNDARDAFARNEREFARGISLRSGTKLVYQLPEGYKKLTGLCGIDPDMRPLGNVVLEFSSEGKTLWSREISGSADSPESIEFDIQKVSRLVLHVDFGKHSDVADHLNICNLRITK